MAYYPPSVSRTSRARGPCPPVAPKLSYPLTVIACSFAQGLSALWPAMCPWLPCGLGSGRTVCGIGIVVMIMMPQLEGGVSGRMWIGEFWKEGGGSSGPQAAWLPSCSCCAALTEINCSLEFCVCRRRGKFFLISKDEFFFCPE